jgi:ParB family transcriptional regulator, chromosome partitioning protein
LTAKEAERLLDGSGWLPEALRLVDASEPPELEGEAGPLPEFLSDDEEREAATDEDRLQQFDAAE